MITEALAAILEQRLAKHGEELVVKALHSLEHVTKPGEDEMNEANDLVNGDRQAAYGSPRPAYEAMAQVWSGLLAHKLTAPLTAEDVVILLGGMKLCREARKHKRDNIVDLHGYALVLSHVLAGAPPTGDSK